MSSSDDAALRDSDLADFDWRELPPGSVKSTFAAPSGDLSFVSMGDPDAERVVLVPGVTGSKEDFSLMLPGLADAGYLVQSFDLAGQYESAAAGPEVLGAGSMRYDYELFVADLIAVLESGRRPAHVLGYSFAGILVQMALVRRPDLFESVSLLSTPPQPGQAFRSVKRIGKLSSMTDGRVGAALMIWGIRRNFVPVSRGRLMFVEHRLAYTRRSSVRDVITLMKKTPDLRNELAASTIPKLIAVGVHDLWPLALHEEFANAIGAQLAVYSTGHGPCETAPHQLNRDLLALFARAHQER